MLQVQKQQLETGGGQRGDELGGAGFDQHGSEDRRAGAQLPRNPKRGAPFVAGSQVFSQVCPQFPHFQFFP
ncbi:MAG: hypothetical protein Kow0069_28460 [Promethearchaeota archaeon]